MNVNFVQEFSNRLGLKIASILKLDSDGQDIVVYGAANLFQMIWSALWVIAAGAVFQVMGQAVLVCMSGSILRKYSGGVHAPSSNSCAAIGAIVSVGFALIVNKVFINFDIVFTICIEIVCMLISYSLIFKYAPVDSKAKRIVRQETRRKFKKYSILTLNIFTLIIIIMDGCYIICNNFKFLTIAQCICMGTIWQSFTLTYTAHKLFNIINIKNFKEEIK